MVHTHTHLALLCWWRYLGVMVLGPDSVLRDGSVIPNLAVHTCSHRVSNVDRCSMCGANTHSFPVDICDWFHPPSLPHLPVDV